MRDVYAPCGVRVYMCVSVVVYSGCMLCRDCVVYVCVVYALDALCVSYGIGTLAALCVVCAICCACVVCSVCVVCYVCGVCDV